jgi:protein TonB
MSRRLTLVILAIMIISGFPRVASTQLKEESTEAHGILGEVKAVAYFAPRPNYPLEARPRWLTGSGIVWLNVDSRTGYVISAPVLKSTGHKILDEAALDAFRQWRFKPGKISTVRIPINFTMRGVKY